MARFVQRLFKLNDSEHGRGYQCLPPPKPAGASLGFPICPKGNCRNNLVRKTFLLANGIENAACALRQPELASCGLELCAEAVNHKLAIQV